MGSALNTYNDFVAGTGDSHIEDPNDLINEAVLRTTVLGRSFKGADKAKVLQGGARIKFNLILDEDSTFQNYLPNDTFTWRNPQVISTGTLDWRFSVDHSAWTEQEITLNAGGGLSRETMFQQFVNIKRSKEQRRATSIVNGMEAKVWAVPHKGLMEAAAGTEQFSIPAFINEQTNGLFGEGAADTGTDITTVGLKWTTVEGIDPALKPRWVPQQVQYGSADPAASGAGISTRNVLQAFDEMFLAIKFEKPKTMEQYFTDPMLNKQVIYTSRRGMSVYQNLLRQSQDTFVTVGRQDPAYASPRYSGVELEYIATLDTAQLYSNDAQTGYTTEVTVAGGAEDIGPRYYWVNHNFLFPVFHTQKYMEVGKVMNHPNQPFTSIQTVNSYWNVACDSRQRQGIVWPAGDVYVT